MTSITIGGMVDPDDWQDPIKLQKYLAGQLIRGRISLVLGAGASYGFGLPQWSELVDRSYVMLGLKRESGLSDVDASEILFTRHFSGDRLAFAKHIRKALYQDFDATSGNFENSPLLSAIGALVMASSRGRVANVVTLNFDDILEAYLSIRGYVVKTVFQLPQWNDPVDLTVLHQHGWLPSNESIDVPRGIVFTQLDYDSVVGNEQDLWRQKALDIFRSNTCIFIGLSGNDSNLSQLLKKTNEDHCSRGSNGFWGVRFSLRDDLKIKSWEARGVTTFPLDDFNELPNWLLEICRQAAERRLEEMNSLS